MRLLFDGTTLCGRDGDFGAGIEHYTVSLLLALAEISPTDDFFVPVPIVMSSNRATILFGKYKNIHIIHSLLPNIPFFSRHFFLPLRAFFTRSDLYFSPSGQLPFGWRGKSVITVHDLCIFDHPEWFPQESSDSPTTRWIVPDSYKRASRIICVSNWTESRLHLLFPQTQNKTIVIAEGVELGNQKETGQTDRFPFDRDYLLCLGTVEPRKNLAHTFAAFDQFFTSHPELSTKVRLIVAGKLGWKTREVEQMAATINQKWSGSEKAGVIVFLGPVTEEEKWYLLSRASCLLFLSTEEGFGLPILEAMSVGTPVIASKGSAIEEIAGDGAMLIDADDVESTALAIAQCVLVPEGLQSLREDGYRRAKQFSWKKTAKETIEVFTSLISNP